MKNYKLQIYFNSTIQTTTGLKSGGCLYRPIGSILMRWYHQGWRIYLDHTAT